MTIKVDSTKETHVVHCSDCPDWRALTLSKLDGLMRANQHERAVHAASWTAFKTLRAYVTRQLDSGNVEVRLEALLRGILRPADRQASDRAVVVGD